STRRPPARPVTVLKASAPIPAPSWHLKLIARRNAPSPTPGASGHARRHPPTSPPVGTPGSADPPEWLVATPPAQHAPRGPESPLRYGPKRQHRQSGTGAERILRVARLGAVTVGNEAPVWPSPTRSTLRHHRRPAVSFGAGDTFVDGTQVSCWRCGLCGGAGCAGPVPAPRGGGAGGGGAPPAP